MKIFEKVSKFFIRNMSQKLNYPATQRNKSYILEVLQKHLNCEEPGHVLEISSGSGQHVSYFAQHFPNLTFQPSECEESLLASIKAYVDDTPTKNIRDPIIIDVTTSYKTWKLEKTKFDYLININMIHVSPFECSQALFSHASKLLKPNGLMITYGAYARNGIITPQSNIDFDRNIRAQNPSWGIRDINDLEKLGAENNIKLMEIYDLPANNKCLIWKNLNTE